MFRLCKCGGVGLGTIATASALVILFSARVASTQSLPPSVVLDWNAPAGCPSALEVELQAARMLGSHPRAGSVATVSVRSDVQRYAPDRYRATLTTTTGGVVRTRSL